ncbi:hypothetical protein SDC9_176100 [bioreactor metagenome]|uniref:Uncharacterized protein n=1 Tax=bioreactor metagenome TaxID=1076179 RepID=A0A645GP62_9ZZZZ
MAFDNGSRNGKRLDDIGINGPLRQPLYGGKFMRFFVEDIYKSLADDFTFALGVSYSGKFLVKAFSGIYTDDVQSEMFVIFENGFKLIFTQQSMIYENTGQVLSNGFVQ